MVRFISHKCGAEYSISKTKSDLHLIPLAHRRLCLCLKIFRNEFHNTQVLTRICIFLRPHYVSSRVDHTNKLRNIFCKSNTFQRSFFPQCIKEWNSLPDEIVSNTSNIMFFNKLLCSSVCSVSVSR